MACRADELGRRARDSWLDLFSAWSDLISGIGKHLTFQEYSFSTLYYNIEKNSLDDFNTGLKQLLSNVSAESRGGFSTTHLLGPTPKDPAPRRSGVRPKNLHL